MKQFSPAVLKTARKASGLSLVELAQRAGLHVNTVTRYEMGLHPTPGSWLRLVHALEYALQEAQADVDAARRLLSE